MNEALVARAIAMLRADADYLADARAGVLVDNSVVGSILSAETGTPRQYAEQAVAEALRRIGCG